MSKDDDKTIQDLFSRLAQASVQVLYNLLSSPVVLGPGRQYCFHKMLNANNISYSKCKFKLSHFPNINLLDQWEKLLSVSICCWVIYVCHIELAIAGCKCF